MAIATMEIGPTHVRWGAVIPGALCAIAIQIVLGLFGAAFGFRESPEAAGVMALPAVWEILTPLVAVFGSTDWRETAPVSERARIVREETECAPCLLRECPIDHRCMSRVAVPRVAAAALELIAA